MFKINQYRKIETNIPLIVDNYEILHFDEYPILYIGTNEFGNKIIGTLANEDDEGVKFRYFHTIVSNRDFSAFLNKEVPYRSIISKSKSTFIIDKDINDKVIDTFQLPTKDIPEDYLPHESSYCPDYGLKLGFNYSISLNGLIADIHEAHNNSLRNITDSFFDLIKNAIGSLKEIKIKHEIVHTPSTSGSFKINFLIKLPEYQNLFLSENDISNYVAEYISYCVDDLHKDVNNVKSKKQDEYVYFNRLLDEKRNIYEKSSVEKEESKLTKDLLDDVNETLQEVEKMSDEIGNGFKEIEIKSKKIESSNEIIVGYIDKPKAQKITNATEYILDVNESESVEKITDREFEILIYNLNTDSRVGNAYVKNDDDPKIMDKPKILIEGDVELAETKYTESIYLNKWITVKARAKKVKGRYKRLSIIGGLK